MTEQQKRKSGSLFDSIITTLLPTPIKQKSQYQRLMSSSFPSSSSTSPYHVEKRNRLRSFRQEVAKSKSGVSWGPSHSFDSEDDDDDVVRVEVRGKERGQLSYEEQQPYGYDFEEMTKARGEESGEGTHTTLEESVSMEDLTLQDSSLGHHNHHHYNWKPQSDQRQQQHHQAYKQDGYSSPKSNNKENDRASLKTSSFNQNFNNNCMNDYHDDQDPENGMLVNMWNSATVAVNSVITTYLGDEGDCMAVCAAPYDCNNAKRRKSPSRRNKDSIKKKNKSATAAAATTPHQQVYTKKKQQSQNIISPDTTTLGIERLTPPSKEISFKKKESFESSLTDILNPPLHNNKNNTKNQESTAAKTSFKAKARVKKLARLIPSPPPPQPPLNTSMTKTQSQMAVVTPSADRNTLSTKQQQTAPFPTILVDQAVPFQRSISELTMRSSYGEAISPISDMRRMAYYAVGKHHSHVNQRGDGGGIGSGNRKCYFTGHPIITGRPFYAGCVQQGLRTLIVFCLPSALGLPRKEDIDKVNDMELKGQISRRVRPNQINSRIMTGLSTAALSQHNSIMNDDEFQSFDNGAGDWTEDENGNVCENLQPEFLLQALPEPSNEILKTMQELYPEQFASLSHHIRRPHCWRLHVKFCFFSGLPIADGEMYYKVLDEVVNSAGKKVKKCGIESEIVLSHEVMEAVSGESAEILTLPCMQTFKYLQKHYKPQCDKLTRAKLLRKVFDRSSWVRVMPEV